MTFIGQKKVVLELNLLMESVLHNNKNYNILFRAPSGYGKTSLAFGCGNYFGSRQYTYSIGKFILDTSKRFHIVDEVHEIKEPEFIYPYMDCGDYTFIFLTNMTGELKEPLVNRCIQFIFEQYTEEELKEIIRMYLSSNDEKAIQSILSRSKGNPRIIKILCQRLQYIMKNHRGNIDVEDVLVNILNINPDGLTELDRRYLNFLGKMRKASLELLCNGTGIDRATIKRDIEPGLLYLNKIKITSRGREII